MMALILVAAREPLNSSKLFDAKLPQKAEQAEENSWRGEPRRSEEGWR
jgi:hypothetical protein